MPRPKDGTERINQAWGTPGGLGSEPRYSLKRVTDQIELADACLRAEHPVGCVLHDVILALAHLTDYIAAKERGDI